MIRASRLGLSARRGGFSTRENALSCNDRALLMPAELISELVWLDPISTDALYQGTTSVVPQASNDEGFSPCGAISLSVRLGAAFRSSTCHEDIIFAAFFSPWGMLSCPIRLLPQPQ
jgi:hypothetical protein